MFDDTDSICYARQYLMRRDICDCLDRMYFDAETPLARAVNLTMFLFHSSIVYQTSITVEFNPTSVISTYELQWKDIEQKWTNASSTSLTASGKKCKAEAHDLNPGMTYCLRLVCVNNNGAKGEPGPELIIDTEQVGCTPKGGGCIIL